MNTTRNLKTSTPRKYWLQAAIVATVAVLLVTPLIPAASAGLGDTGCFAVEATYTDGGQVGQTHGPGCGPIADGGGSVVVPTPTLTPTPTPEEICTPESRQREADELTASLTATLASSEFRSEVQTKVRETFAQNFNTQLARGAETRIQRTSASVLVSDGDPCADDLRVRYNIDIQQNIDWRESAGGSWAMGAYVPLNANTYSGDYRASLGGVAFSQPFTSNPSSPNYGPRHPFGVKLFSYVQGPKTLATDFGPVFKEMMDREIAEAAIR